MEESTTWQRAAALAHTLTKKTQTQRHRNTLPKQRVEKKKATRMRKQMGEKAYVTQ